MTQNEFLSERKQVPAYVSIPKAAKQLGVSRDVIERLIRERHIKAVKFGTERQSRVHIEIDSLIKYLEENQLED